MKNKWYHLKYRFIIKTVKILHYLFKKKVKVNNTYSDGQGIVEYQEHLSLFKRTYIHHWYYGSEEYRIIKIKEAKQ